VDEIADQVRGPLVAFNAEQLLTQPVDSGPAGRETYSLLRNAYEWDPAGLSANSLANLAIAAAWMPQKEIALARELSLKLVSEWRKKASGQSIQPRLEFALYHTFLAANEDSNNQSVDALRFDAAQRMIEMCSSSRSLDQRDLAQFYRRIVEPLEEPAKKQRKHEFFADAAGLVSKFREFKWDFGTQGNKPITVVEKLEQLYSNAIGASDGKIGKYFKARADVRLGRDHDLVLADVKQLKQFKEFEAQAFALEGHIVYLQSKASVNLTTRLKGLEAALQSLKRAEELAEKTRLLSRDDLAQVLYFCSLAHLERGNFDLYVRGDSRLSKREFVAAKDYAEKVIEQGGGPNLQYAYEAAANAYEDLAWIAGGDTAEKEGNFFKAVTHLQHSVAVHHDSVRARMALGRCYYKMIADSHVLPKELQSTYAQVLSKASKELNEAITLAGEGKDVDGSLPEVHLWLGRVIQASNLDADTLLGEAKTQLTEEQFRQANDHFSKAFQLAKAAKLSPAYLANYALAWGEHSLLNPVLNPDFQSANAAEKKSAVDEILLRADQLAELQEGRTYGLDPVQEAGVLRAKAELVTKSPVAVLNSLQAQADRLAKLALNQLTVSDTKLMEFRLSLQQQLQPHQLTKEVVNDAVNDALWYSTTSAGQNKVRVLLNAMKLSQQVAPKDTIETAVANQVKCVQRIIDARLADDFDFQGHEEVFTGCVVGLKQAAGFAQQRALLLQTTTKYLRYAIESAKKRKLPQKDISQLTTWLVGLDPSAAK
jgi:hypothetical protein